MQKDVDLKGIKEANTLIKGPSWKGKSDINIFDITYCFATLKDIAVWQLR